MRASLLFFIVLAVSFGEIAGAETVCFDFESGDLQGWRVVEGAFGQLVCSRDREHHQGRPYTKQGKWFLSTLETKDGKPFDGFVGCVESPVVVLSAPDIKVRIGGGTGPDVSFAVCGMNEQELAVVRGENSQTMREVSLSLPACVGKPVFFRVTDSSTGSWGHLTVDDVRCEGSIDAALTKKRVHTPAVQSEPMRDNAWVNAAPVLFVTRKQYRNDHHNTATLFQHGEVNEYSYDTQGCLKLLDPKTGKVETLLNPGPGATVRDPDVHFDGTQILFSLRKSRTENYHIYRMDVKTRAVTQLTRMAEATDIDPVWLPDGGIVFASTREPKYCGCNNRIMCNLYRMDADGANIHQIGRSTLFEGHPHVMDDGRILYDRWEYVDRAFGDAQGIWTCNPDGTGHALYWGNNTQSPGAILNARTLPGDGSRMIAALTACHNRPWGALGIIDRNKGMDGREPVLRTWPAYYVRQIGADSGSFDSPNALPLKYQDPFPLDDSHFLCVRQMKEGNEATGIFYLDLDGAERLVHFEAPGCYDPMPLRPRRLPAVRPTQRNYLAPHAPGRFYLQNVSIGTHMAGVTNGMIKALRIVESPEKRNWTLTNWGGQGTQWPGMNWLNFENKRILGTVPVEPDGSAYFEVPGNTFVFFQALDENGMMVQSMRSGTYVQPGETYGCVGCHENRIGGAPVKPGASAMRRAPDKMNGWLGEPPRMFSFQKEVQPIFDKHCVSCHDYGKRAGEKLNLAGDRDVVFCTSYVDLWLLNGIRCVGAGPAWVQPAFSWGARVSKIVRAVLREHGSAKLSEREKTVLVTWCDLNAPYYPNFECAYPNNQAGRSPLTGEEKKRMETLSGVRIAESFGRQRSQVSFTRPEYSRILQAPGCQTNAAAKAEVLKIIRTGRDRLAQKPRNDMDGFFPCEKDLCRLEKYRRSEAMEAQVYSAIREGRKLADPESLAE